MSDPTHRPKSSDPAASAGDHLDMVRRRLAEIEQGLEQREQRLVEAERRLGEQMREEFNRKIRAMRAELAEQQRRYGEQVQQITTISHERDRIAAQLQASSEERETLGRKVRELSEACAARDREIESLTEQLERAILPHEVPLDVGDMGLSADAGAPRHAGRPEAPGETTPDAPDLREEVRALRALMGDLAGPAASGATAADQRSDLRSEQTVSASRSEHSASRITGSGSGISNLKSQISDAGSGAHQPGGTPSPRTRPPARASSSRRRGAVAVLMVMAAVAALGGSAKAWYEWTSPRHVIGTLVVPPGDAETVRACVQAVSGFDRFDVTSDVDRGVITFAATTKRPVAMRISMDVVGGRVAADFDRPGEETMDRPEAGPTNADGLAAFRKRLATLWGELERLHEEDEPLRALKRERDTIIQGLGDVRSARLAQEALIEDAANALVAQQVSADRIAAAEAEDLQLQSDLAALAQRESSLATSLLEIMEAGGPRVADFSRAATEAEAVLAGALAEDYGPEVGRDVEAMHAAVTAWGEAAATLARVWTSELEMLAGPEGRASALTCLAAIEPEARAFLDDSEEIAAAFDRAMTDLAQGEDQPTKRMVLRNRLVRALEPLREARTNAESAARAVLPMYNASLAALARGAQNLAPRIASRRQAIVEELRRAQRDEIRAKTEQARAEAVAEEQRLARREDALGRKLDELNLRHAELLEAKQAGLFALLDVFREVETGLASAEHGAAPPDGQDDEQPVVVRALPVRVEAPSLDDTQILLIALGPLAAGLLLGAVPWVLRRSRGAEG